MRGLMLAALVLLAGCADARFRPVSDAHPAMTPQEAYNECKPQIREATYSNLILPGGLLNPMNTGRQETIDGVEGRCMAQYGYEATW
jgi:hypothetical protein